MNVLNFEYLERNISQIIQYYNSTTEIEFIHYGTFHELWDHAIFLIGEKQNFDNQLHAFISFWKKDNLFTENVLIDKAITNKDKEIIFSSFTADTKEYEFRQISDMEFYEEINRVLPNIKKAILDNPTTMKDPLDWSNPATYWGIFVNNTRIDNLEKYSLPIAGNIINAYFLSSRWNDIKIFAETTSQYLYFKWSTGA